MTYPTGEMRYDLELLGFPWSEPDSAAQAVAPAFGITVEEALEYVYEAPLLVVKGASEHVVKQYVAALHAAGAAVRVRSREGEAWVVAAPTPQDTAPFAGEIPADEGDTLPTWLLPAVAADPKHRIWPAPSSAEERIKEMLAEEDLVLDANDWVALDDDFGLLDGPLSAPGATAAPALSARDDVALPPNHPVRGARRPASPSPFRSQRPQPEAARATPPEPAAPAPADKRALPVSRQRPQRYTAQNEAVRFYAPPDVSGVEKNPFLDRIDTGEVFRQGLALLRAAREKNADPLDEALRRNRSHPTEKGKKGR